MTEHLHHYLYDWVQEGHCEDNDEVVDDPLEGEALAQPAHRGGHGRHQPRQPDEGDGQAAPAVVAKD